PDHRQPPIGDIVFAVALHSWVGRNALPCGKRQPYIEVAAWGNAPESPLGDSDDSKWLAIQFEGAADHTRIGAKGSRPVSEIQHRDERGRGRVIAGLQNTAGCWFDPERVEIVSRHELAVQQSRRTVFGQR